MIIGFGDSSMVIKINCFHNLEVDVFELDKYYHDDNPINIFITIDILFVQFNQFQGFQSQEERERERERERITNYPGLA